MNSWTSRIPGVQPFLPMCHKQIEYTRAERKEYDNGQGTVLRMYVCTDIDVSKQMSESHMLQSTVVRILVANELPFFQSLLRRHLAVLSKSMDLCII